MRASLIICLVLLGPTLQSAHAQSGCRSACRLTATHELSLGTANGIGALSEPSAIARDVTLRRYLVAGYDDGVITIFDLAGKPIGMLERSGRGPGEFQLIRAIVPRADGLYFLDIGTDRVSVLDRSFKPLRTMTIPRAESAVVTADGDVVINAKLASAAHTGFPLHLVDETTSIRSFGERKEATPGDRYAQYRKLAASHLGGVWSTRHDQYVLERWTVDGRKVQSFDLSTKWFRPHTDYPRWTPDEPPPPLIRAIREHPDGYVLVAISIPDPNWKTSLKPIEKEHPHGLKFFPENIHAYFDTVIEAIDRDTGSRLGIVRLGQLVSNFVDDERVATYVEDQNGIPQINIWKLQLMRR